MADPYGSSWFSVAVAGLGSGGTDYLFHKVDGLNRTYDVEQVAEGGRNHAPRSLWKGPAKNGQVSLSSGVITATDLWEWSRAVDSKTDFKKTVTIKQYAHAGKTLLQTYRLTSAWPVTWSASSLAAGEGKLAIVDLKLAYDDLLVGATAVSPAEPTKASLATIEGPQVSFSFPINPSKLAFGRSISWGPSGSVNTAYPPLAVPGGAMDSLGLSGVILDGGDTKTSIAPMMQSLHGLLLPVSIPGLIAPRVARVRFTWKDLRFEGGINKISFDVTLFSSAGDPLRASMSMDLTGQILFGGTASLVTVNATT